MAAPAQRPQIGGSELRRIVNLAMKHANRQGFLPDSPCRSYRGRMLFCTGALIVRTALALLRSEAAARAFERSLARSGDKRLILAGAREIGLPVAMVEQAVVSNDAFPLRERVSAIGRYLRELRDGLAVRQIRFRAAIVLR